MNTCRRINSEWLFFKQPLSDTTTTLSPTPPAQNDSRFYPVNLPHDWLIANSADHYENSEGWYQKTISSDILPFDASSDDDWLLYFEGVYMDCTIFVNGMQAGEWKYGYSSFEVRLTPFLKTGENTILVHVRYQSPNSRWYSGAGIYRSVWLKKVPAVHIASDGIAAETHRLENGNWSLCMHTTLEKEGIQQSAKDFFASENDNPNASLSLSFCVQTLDGTVILSEIPKDTPVTLTNIQPWDINEPNLYKIVCTLSENSTAIQTETITTGFRTTRFDTNEGFFLNDVHIKLKGVCQHHDLGALGSAVNRSAIKRQLTILKSMGVNAVRTTHNMPAVELLELADEMGILIVDEAFDMWEMSKTTYDYARFFKEWSARDVKSWICRDRNHPCVILWSIGNEIYDTHANEHGQEITRYLKEQVLLHDPYGHALPTIGSNFMQGENARKCADILKIAGYNYAERLYNKQHADHPDWVIYGSETSSTVQSRGIYHFPLAKPLLTDDDGQCSSLGNSTVNWLERYPQIIIVSNTRSETIKTDIVDDHYYNMPEFFAENIDIYDDYSRKNPNIFVGEFAVNQTYEGQLRAAISEAMFMVGFERNQDVVKLCSYAPLFSHVHYQSWYPNLIMFDNSRSYVIPSYYCFKLFGANRGDMVVSSKESCEKIYLSMHGLPVINGDCGLTWKNAVFNSIPVFPTKSLHGKAIQDNDSYVLQENDADEFTNQSIRSQILPGIALGNDVESREGSFTVQILAEKGKRIGVGMLCSPKPFSYYDRTDPNPKDPWMLFNLEPLRWIVEGNTAALYRGGISLTQYSEPKQISLRYGEYNEFHYELTKTAVSLYLNGKLIDTVELPHYQSMCSVTTDTDDSVIIKIVNFSETDDPVCISIDCDVKSEYEVSQLTGKADFENSLDNPDQVHDTTTMLTGAGRCFTFNAPGLSVNVLKLKKK